MHSVRLLGNLPLKVERAFRLAHSAYELTNPADQSGHKYIQKAERG